MLCTDPVSSTSLISCDDLNTIEQIFQRTGFAIVENNNTRSIATEIANEAGTSTQRFKRATINDDTIVYSADIAPLGPKAQVFLKSAQLANTFRVLTGHRHNLTEHMSCITVYASGDQLSPHIDQPANDCGLTCILYLSCKSPEPLSSDTGLRLQVYGWAQRSIHETPVLEIPSVSGRMVIGKGAQVWHGRPPLQNAESVMALTSCFHRDS